MRRNPDAELAVPDRPAAFALQEAHPLLDEHFEELYVWAYHVGRRSGAVSDLAWQVAANTLVAVAHSMRRKPQSFPEKRQLFVYVETAVRRALVSARRTQAIESHEVPRYVDDDELDPVAVGSHEHALVQHEASTVFRAAVDSLPDQTRRVHELRFIQQLPLDEVAQTLGISRRTVDGHVSAIYKHFRTVAKNYEDGHVPAGYVNPFRRVRRSAKQETPHE